MEPKTYIVTGGLGFIGSNFVQLLYDETEETHDQIIIIDKMTYAASLDNIPEEILWDHRINIWTPVDLAELFSKDSNPVSQPIDGIFHFAAESHVDNSISGPDVFIDANVRATLNILKIAQQWNARFLHVSTDEVYGALGEDDDSFVESMMLAPNNVYAATKTSAEMLVRAFNKTNLVDTVITRCCNNYGPRQHKEKLLPKTILNALAEQPIPVYGAGDNIREWIHVDDHCRAIWHAYNHGQSGEVYNIGSGVEITNLQLVNHILELTDRPATLIEFVEDRKGHDFRYSINCDKLKDLGWSPEISSHDEMLSTGLPQTIEWYKQAKKSPKN